MMVWRLVSYCFAKAETLAPAARLHGWHRAGHRQSLPVGRASCPRPWRAPDRLVCARSAFTLKLRHDEQHAHRHFSCGACQIHPAEGEAMHPHAHGFQLDDGAVTSIALRPSLSSFVTTSTSSASSRSSNRMKPGRCSMAELPRQFRTPRGADRLRSRRLQSHGLGFRWSVRRSKREGRRKCEASGLILSVIGVR